MAGKRGMKQHQFSLETKLEAIKLHLEDGLTVRDVMDRFGVAAQGTVHAWCAAYRKSGAQGLMPSPKGRLPATRESTEEELGRLRMENEVLRAFLSAAGRR